MIFEIMLVLFVTSIGGCVKHQDAEPMMAKVPTISLGATVVSLSTDTNIECEGKCPGNVYPKDKGVIRIDKILSINNPYNWELEGVEEGNEVQIELYYSSRPAKVKRIPASARAKTAGDNSSSVSGVPTFAKPIPKEDGYFIYEFETTLLDKETETILPGLKVGSKLSATISYSSPTMITVYQYQIIP